MDEKGLMMTKKHNNVLDAKRSLKIQITFMETLIKHLNGPDKALRTHAMWASWCFDQYFNNRFLDDIHNAIKENTPADGKINA